MTFQQPKANKFRAKKHTLDGIEFDSKKEAFRWQQLRTLEKAGEIRNLRRQVKFSLEGRNGPVRYPSNRTAFYKADFVYEDKRLNWAQVIEDAKGFQTDKSKLQLAVLAAQGIEVTLI